MTTLNAKIIWNHLGTEYYFTHQIKSIDAQWGRFLGQELYTITLNSGEVIPNCMKTTSEHRYKKLDLQTNTEPKTI